MSGVSLRIAQLLHPESKRGVVIAFDHGGSGLIPGGENALDVLRDLAASPAEGVLVGPGLARHAVEILSRPGTPRLVVAVDAPIFSTLPGNHGALLAHRSLLSPKAALAMGATAAKILLPVGQDGVESFADSVQLVAHTAEQAYRVGLPLMVEPALWGPKVEEHGDELIAHASRVAVELGAALLKIPAPRNDPTLSAIVENSPIPVYVLGGTPAGAGSLAQELSRCISNGITGVVVGRNVWSRPRPRKAVEGLAAAVHHGDMNGCQKLLEEADEG